MIRDDQPSVEVDLPEDDADFASEHARLTTTEAVSSGSDVRSDPDIPLGFGGMDLKRTHLLD
jgi:hypothetical protein